MKKIQIEFVEHEDPYQARHKKFQFGKNPLEMSDFEKGLVAKEKMDRMKAKYDYTQGILGVDGGHCPYR